MAAPDSAGVETSDEPSPWHWRHAIHAYSDEHLQETVFDQAAAATVANSEHVDSSIVTGRP